MKIAAATLLLLPLVNNNVSPNCLSYTAIGAMFYLTGTLSTGIGE